MSEANRHAQSKDLLHLCCTRGLARRFHHEIRLLVCTQRQTWRPTYRQAAAERQPIFARPVRVKDPDPHNPTHTITTAPE
jgi:hypothetical protein